VTLINALIVFIVWLLASQLAVTILSIETRVMNESKLSSRVAQDELSRPFIWSKDFHESVKRRLNSRQDLSYCICQRADKSPIELRLFVCAERESYDRAPDDHISASFLLLVVCLRDAKFGTFVFA
jgi:hypothetical protein